MAKKSPQGHTRRVSRMPGKDALLTYMKDNPGASTKREIVRAFGLKGADKIALKSMLKELQEEEAITPRGGKRFSPSDHLPPVAVIETVARGPDGHLSARAVFDGVRDPRRITVMEERRAHIDIKIGDRILARLEPGQDGDYLAHPIRKLEHQSQAVLGVIAESPDGLVVQSVDKKGRKTYPIAPDSKDTPPVGSLVRAELLAAKRGRAYAPREARIVERFADVTDPRAFSLISIFSLEIPHVFPQGVIEAANKGAEEAITLGQREDLTAMPLVTIDGADARDFDDAVFAEADDSPANAGGWKITVAIADVAHYVRPDSPLDREARKRGNSVYFTDRVVPMLPEALSNGSCSLKPDEPRFCLAVHMTLDKDGKTKNFRFVRGLMRSKARLTYEAVEAAHKGEKTDIPAGIVEGTLPALYGAFKALLTERQRRGTLEFDLPERKVVLDDKGKVSEITRRLRLDSHRLIEEFMIAANVSAARALGD